MQKLVNALAVLSFLGTAAIIGGGTYVYLQRDALIEGVKIEISDSKITLAETFFKKIGKIDTNIYQMEINRSTGAFYLEGEMSFQGTAINVAARGNCTT